MFRTAIAAVFLMAALAAPVQAGPPVNTLKSAGKTLAKIRCTPPRIHGANHTFPLVGKKCHLQTTCYLKGVRNSHVNVRIPLPDKFCPKGLR